MNIALSWINTGDPKTGLEIFAGRFLEALARTDRRNRYLITGAFWRDYELRVAQTRQSLPEGFDYAFRRRPRNLENMLDWRTGFCFQERELLRWGINLYHGLDETLPPLRKIKSLITVHDIGFDIHPEWFPASRSVFSWHYTLGQALRQAETILAISRYTKEELVNYYRLKPEKIRVVYYGGADLKFRPVKEPDRLSNYRKKHRLPERFVLSVAPLVPHKNIVRLVEAFAWAAGKHPDVHLVLVGRPAQDYPPVLEEVKKRKMEKRVVFIPEVNNAELVFFYNLAEVFLFPSLYEGFGLPVIEAMACGCPVITSNVASLPEVAGPAGLLVDPHRTEEIGAALQDVLENRELREKMQRDSLAQAQKFSWDRNVRETRACYNELS